MYVSPGSKWNRAEVTFHSPEERYKFGLYAPSFTSKEHFRWNKKYGSPLAMVFPIRSYSDRAIDFPQSTEIPYRVLGKVVGELIPNLDAPNQAAVEVDRDIVRAIGEFFVDKANGLFKRPA